MSKRQPVSPVIAVLREAFPTSRLFWHESADLWWNEYTLTRDSEIEPLSRRQQDESLEGLARGLRLAAASYRNLATPVRAEVERVHLENARARLPKAPRSVTRDRLKGPSGESEVIVSVLALLERLHVGVLGSWPQELDGPTLDQENAMLAARRLVHRMPSKSSKEQAADTSRKVVLVQRARELWEQELRRQPPAKKLNPATEFARFLSDLIEAIGEDWDAVSTFNAWRRAKVDR